MNGLMESIQLDCEINDKRTVSNIYRRVQDIGKNTLCLNSDRFLKWILKNPAKGNRSQNTFEQWNISVLQYPEQVPVLAKVMKMMKSIYRLAYDSHYKTD